MRRLRSACRLLGKKKTAERVKKRFYWPTLYKDVEDYCKACEECQKCSPGRGTRVPLVPLPIITEPFQRIAMDIVGPLPRSQMGNKYKVTKKFAKRKQAHVGMKSSKTNQTRRERHHNTFTPSLHLVPFCQNCVFVFVF